MKDYDIEYGNVDLKRLESGIMNKNDYIKAHSQLVIPCHDVFINYKNGILLVKRNNLPAKGILWPIGGRIKRGIATEASLAKKVKEECNLELQDLQYLDVARTFFQTDPFDHNKGTDTLNLIYFGKGKGDLRLDDLHEEPTMISLKHYTQDFRKTLHPYVRDFMDLVISWV